jgi:hypothetical protein
MPKDIWAKAYESACSDPRLTPADFRVYIAVRIRTGDKGGCWEIVETIGTRAAMSGRNAQKSLNKLLKLGYLVSIPDHSKKTGRRLELTNSVLPPTTDRVKKGDESVLPGVTNSSPNIDQGIRPSSTPTTKTTGEAVEESSSSSSSSEVASLGGGEKSPDHQDFSQHEYLEAEGIAYHLFDWSDAVSTRVRKLCQDFGGEGAIAALQAAAARIYNNGSAIDWSYVEGIAKNQKREGGAMSRSKTGRRLAELDEFVKEFASKPPKVKPSKTRPMTYFTLPPLPTPDEGNP